MDHIHIIATFAIPPEHLARFQELVNIMVERVRETEPGALRYAWHYNEDRSQCVALETYANSQAVMDHVTNVGKELGEMVSLTPPSIQMLGPISPELAAVAGSFGAKVFAQLDGVLVR